MNLSGYKTYLTVAAAGLATIAAVATGHMPVIDGGVALLALGAQAFLRAGSKTDAKKVIEEVGSAAAVAAAVAPIVGAVSPQLADVAARVEDLAEQLRAATARAALSPEPAGINKLG